MRAILAVLDPQDVGGALVGGQQVGAVRGRQHVGERVGAGEQADEVVIRRGAEDGGDDVVPGALGAELDAEAFGEEVEQPGGEGGDHRRVAAPAGACQPAFSVSAATARPNSGLAVLPVACG